MNNEDYGLFPNPSGENGDEEEKTSEGGILLPHHIYKLPPSEPPQIIKPEVLRVPSKPQDLQLDPQDIQNVQDLLRGTTEEEAAKNSQDQLWSVYYPWKLFDKKAKEVSSDWAAADTVFELLEEREQIIWFKRETINKLKSNDEAKVLEAWEDLKKFTRSEQIAWSNYYLKSSEPFIWELANQFMNEQQIDPQEVNEAQFLVKEPWSSFDVADEWLIKGGDPTHFLKPGSTDRDMGRELGSLRQSTESLLEQLLSRVTDTYLEGNPTASDWGGMIERMTQLVDVFIYSSQQEQLNQPLFVEKIVVALNKVSFSANLETTWNLLSRFHIPDGLTADTLTQMDRFAGFSHILANYLLSRLPAEHPRVREQFSLAEELQDLCAGSLDEVMSWWPEITQLSESLISLFPLGLPEEQLGYDVELFPSIIGPNLPEGVEVGIDGNDRMPELRLTPTREVLVYSQEWRQRLFFTWLWNQLSKCREVSMHLHVDRAKNDALRIRQETLFKLLFGSHDGDFRRGDNNTWEIRTALRGYNFTSAQTTGIEDGWNVPRFAESLLALNHADYYHQQRDEIIPKLDPLQQRFRYLVSLTPDPTARAAMILALDSPYGTRFKSKDDEGLIPRNSSYTREDFREVKVNFSNFFLLSPDARFNYLDNELEGLLSPARTFRMEILSEAHELLPLLAEDDQRLILDKMREAVIAKRDQAISRYQNSTYLSTMAVEILSGTTAPESRLALAQELIVTDRETVAQKPVTDLRNFLNYYLWVADYMLVSGNLKRTILDICFSVASPQDLEGFIRDFAMRISETIDVNREILEKAYNLYFERTNNSETELFNDVRNSLQGLNPAEVEKQYHHFMDLLDLPVKRKAAQPKTPPQPLLNPPSQLDNLGVDDVVQLMKLPFRRWFGIDLRKHK